jgi:hypothetical protein
MQIPVRVAGNGLGTSALQTTQITNKVTAFVGVVEIVDDTVTNGPFGWYVIRSRFDIRPEEDYNTKIDGLSWIGTACTMSKVSTYRE